MNKKDAVCGCLTGTAVGDAMGLAYEGLSRSRGKKLYGSPDRYYFLFKRGMVSDDTEHAYMIYLSCLEAQHDLNKFDRYFSRRLKWWFLSLPAGVGLATARSCIKILLGFPLKYTGVFSAGNGPAMRSAILGVLCEDLQTLKLWNHHQTVITHKDPKAEEGSLAVALAAYLAKTHSTITGIDFLTTYKSILPDCRSEFISLLENVVESVQRQESLEDYLKSRKLQHKVSGYVYHCIPAVIHCWLSHQHQFELAIKEIISCGGDTDTNAAMIGGIIGSDVGLEGIPQQWQTQLESSKLIHQASELVDHEHCKIPFSLIYPWWFLSFPRNLFFLCIVLAHGFRRLLPPY